MRISTTIVLSALLPLVASCAEHRATDRLPPPVPSTTPTSNTTIPEGNSPPAAGRATSVPDTRTNGASSGAGLPPDPDKDKPRGNTPPGMDRSGGGPMDGAIRDPAGVVTKQPEPKAPVQ
jgi:hypothetical protein